MREECARFLACIANNTQPLTNAREGLAVTRIVEKAVAALAQKNFHSRQTKQRRA